MEPCGVTYFPSLPEACQDWSWNIVSSFFTTPECLGAAAMTLGTDCRAPVDASSQRAGRTEQKLAVSRAGTGGLHLKEAYRKGHCYPLLSYRKADFPQG